MTLRVLGLGLVVVLAAGCGGSSSVAAEDSSPTSTTTTSTTRGADGVARFAGSWYHHGVSVTVSASGSIEARYRVYEWCTDHPQPCDEMDGNEIKNGGHLVGHLEPFTPRSAKVIVESDTAELVIDDAAIFELLDDGKARLADLILCGDETTNGRECGA